MSPSCQSVCGLNPFVHVRTIYISGCVLGMICTAAAVSPTLSIKLVPPASVRFSWPSNFTDWQLMSSTNLSSSNWLAVAQPASLSNSSLVVTVPLTNKSGYFRLAQTNSGSCVFQATPPVITSGGSSTLTWCPVAGTTYRLSPGPGVVTGGSFVVSPTTSTVYTLVASNATGLTTNFTAVIVNPCGFASVSNWNATITFTYMLAPSAPGYSFNINRQTQVTMHLTPYVGAVFSFDGTISGMASINDREDDTSAGSLITTTTIGSGSPDPSLSICLLGINCTSNSYNLSAAVFVGAIDTEIAGGPPSSYPTIANTGQFVIFPRPLPVADSTLSGSAVVQVVELSLPTTDYYAPNDFIANDMWTYGVITDATAGTATISWSITPAP